MIKAKVDVKLVEWVSSTTTAVFKVELEKYIGNYWCEGIQYPFMNVVTSNKVLAYKKESHEFSLLYVYTVPNPPCFQRNDCLDAYRADTQLSNDKLLKKDGISERIRFMEITDFYVFGASLYIAAIVHISTDIKHNLLADYFLCKDNLAQEPVKFFRSSQYCLPENLAQLTWPLTKINTVVPPREICIQENGKPVTRNCQGNFVSGAEWRAVNGECSDQIEVPDATILLHQIAWSNITSNESKMVSALSENTRNLTSLDFYYFENALQKMEKSLNTSNTTGDFIKTISNLMTVESEVLRNAQEVYGSTDNILYITESFYKDFHDFSANTSRNLLEIRENNLIVQLSKPYLNNVFGIALYDNSSFQNVQTKSVHPTDIFINEQLLLAVVVPQNILGNTSLNSSQLQDVILQITVFSNDHFFVQLNKTSHLKVDNLVVSVSISGYEGYLQTPLEITFKTNPANSTCAFWDYSNNLQRKKGTWSNLGGNQTAKNVTNTYFVSCSFSHLTPFTLLMNPDTAYGVYPDTPSSAMIESYNLNYPYLNVITIFGTTLSMLSISVIFLTTLVIKRFRKKTGTKILLQLSVAILLELALIQIADRDSLVQNRDLCRATGILLHYILLCKFAWMLVFAFLQYRRFVQVMKPKPSKMLQKTSLFAWSFPVLPVVISASIDVNSYSAGLYRNFCYPKGGILLWGVLFPIVVIVFLNICVFSAIMFNILHKSDELYSVSTSQKMKTFYLSILLFFMLGIPWLFGIFGEMFAVSWFNYAFCILATLEGFVLFVFYVAFNRGVRNEYYKLLFKNRICKNK